MPDITTTTIEKDLHTAITELILCLKGDGTVSFAQKRTGIHRNMLTAIFEVYDAQMRGETIKTKSERNPRIKNLYWGTNSIITIADKLGIRVSELIRAAEDVQDGLPPWFQRRISRGINPPHSQSIDKLGRIFLEALGCLTYDDPFLPIGALKNVRQYHKKDSSEIPIAPYELESYTEEECRELNRTATLILESGDLSEFAKAFQSEKITSKDAYDVLKKAFERVREKHSFEGKIEPEQLYDTRVDFVSAIRHAFLYFGA